MAKQQYTWSVRGIGHEVRERAKKSAGNRRVTIGEWVSLALIEIADEELAAAPDSLPAIGPSQAVADAAGLGDRERALLALATRPPPATTKAEHELLAPWSVRGVSQVARVKAAQAAAHRRATIGEWVSHAIVTYSDREAGIESPHAAPAARQVSEDETERTMRLVEALARHIDETGSATPSTGDLSTESRPAPAAASPVATLSTPAQQAPAPSAPVETAAPSLADRKISELADRLRDNEQRNDQRLVTLTSALTIFADRLKLTGGEARPAKEAASPAPIAAPARAAPVAAPATAGERMSETELAFWETVKDSKESDDFQAYLETYPNGVFAPIARRRMAHASSGQEGSPAAAPTTPSGDAATRRRPPAGSYPKLDFNTLNQRAIENTRRLNSDKD